MGGFLIAVVASTRYVEYPAMRAQPSQDQTWSAGTSKVAPHPQELILEAPRAISRADDRS